MTVVTTHEALQGGVDFSEHDRVVAVNVTPDELEGEVLYIEYTDKHGKVHHVEATGCKII